VVAVNAEESLLDKKSGVFRLLDADPVCYIHGKYYETGSLIGKFGFSVQKKKKAVRKK
jgi:hypothetical protein